MHLRVIPLLVLLTFQSSFASEIPEDYNCGTAAQATASPRRLSALIGDPDRAVDSKLKILGMIYHVHLANRRFDAPLLAALQDKWHPVRSFAVYILSQGKAWESGVVRSEVRALLEKGNLDQRITATHALSMWRDDETTTLLRDLMNRGGLEGSVAAAILRSFDPTDKASLDHLSSRIRSFQDRGFAVTLRAIWRDIGVSDPVLEEAMAAYLGNEDPSMRRNALIGLAQRPDLSPENVDRILNLVSDPDADVRRELMEQIGIHIPSADPNEQFAALRIGLNDREPKVYMPAARIMGTLGSPEALAIVFHERPTDLNAKELASLAYLLRSGTTSNLSLLRGQTKGGILWRPLAGVEPGPRGADIPHILAAMNALQNHSTSEIHEDRRALRLASSRALAALETVSREFEELVNIELIRVLLENAQDLKPTSIEALKGALQNGMAFANAAQARSLAKDLLEFINTTQFSDLDVALGAADVVRMIASKYPGVLTIIDNNSTPYGQNVRERLAQRQ